jgi:hypothetical protein
MADAGQFAKELGALGPSDDPLVFDPTNPRNDPEKPPIDWQLARRRLATALQQIAQGGTFDTADEIGGAAAGAKSWLTGDGFGKGYDDYVDWAREAQRRGEEESPGLAEVAHMGGGFLPIGATGVKLFGKLMEEGRPLLSKALGALATSGVYGGGQGALQGAGASEDGVMNRLEGAWEGLKDGVVMGLPFGLLGLKGAHGRRPRPVHTPTPAHEVPVSMRDAGEMSSAGVPADKIAMQTGWKRGDDGVWRQTLPGSLA